MKKKALVGVLITMLAVSMLAACGQNNAADNKNDSKTESVEKKKEEKKETKETEETEEAKESEEKSKEETEEKASSAELGDKYVDLDNRSFAVNGKVYTLGVNTLQDMIDDGVPFDEDDIANANNNLSKNTESQGFKIDLGDYYSAQVYVANTSDDNMTTADCKLTSIYMPIDLKREQNVLEFAFPLTITEEELLAQAGEPTDSSEYVDGDYTSKKIEYKVDSEKYFKKTGYKFEFENGVLRYLTIDWLE